MGGISIMVSCQAGECGISCVSGSPACLCWSHPDTGQCGCNCDAPPHLLNKYYIRGKAIRGKANPFLKMQRIIKADPQARINVCIRSMPITQLAQSLDKVLPNKILVPADRVNKKVTLRLKNKTLRQIISTTGLTLKS